MMNSNQIFQLHSRISTIIDYAEKLIGHVEQYMAAHDKEHAHQAEQKAIENLNEIIKAVKYLRTKSPGSLQNLEDEEIQMLTILEADLRNMVHDENKILIHHQQIQTHKQRLDQIRSLITQRMRAAA